MKPGRLVVSAVLMAALPASSGCEDPASRAPAAAVTEPATAPATASNRRSPRGEADRRVLRFSNAGSKIGFVASKVTASHAGSFDRFSGRILLGEDLTASEIEVEIDAGSIAADQRRLTNHLRSPDFFDAARFPTASFRSTAITAGGEGGATHTVTGTLPIRDQSKAITFPATIALSNNQVTAQAEFSIDRQQWGLVYPGMPDDLIRDRVLIKLEVAAGP
jgi:polyisoprenoid-binding protein YceI